MFKKKWLLALVLPCMFLSMAVTDDCNNSKIANNTSALDEQVMTEQNQQGLLAKQPPPHLTWSLERDNLTKRMKLQNDRAVNFFMYVFIEGVADPVGYYMINKASSVDSQLTNTSQLIQVYSHGGWETQVLPSPAEDGSYGTNGDGVFGFTPEDIYIQTNMHYILATVPLNFARPVQRLAIISTDEARKMLEISKDAMK